MLARRYAAPASISATADEPRFQTSRLPTLRHANPQVEGLRHLSDTRVTASVPDGETDSVTPDHPQVEGLRHLSELRVLNLAGNLIERLDAAALSGLLALTELNARRNKISSIDGVETLPSLQRLFLSYNQLTALEQLVPLTTIGSLVRAPPEAASGGN